jgi:hypothetical protein
VILLKRSQFFSVGVRARNFCAIFGLCTKNHLPVVASKKKLPLLKMKNEKRKQKRGKNNLQKKISRLPCKKEYFFSQKRTSHHRGINREEKRTRNNNIKKRKE